MRQRNGIQTQPSVINTYLHCSFRKNTLQLLQKITVEFVKHVSKKRNLSQSMIDTAGGKIFTFGSYRLGVYGPGGSTSYTHLMRLLSRQVC